MLDFSFQNFRNLTGSVGEVKFNSSCIYCQINHEFKMVFFWGGEKREWFLHADYRLGYFCWSISCLFLSRVDRKNHLIRANLYFFWGGGEFYKIVYIFRSIVSFGFFFTEKIYLQNYRVWGDSCLVGASGEEKGFCFFFFFFVVVVVVVVWICRPELLTCCILVVCATPPTCFVFKCVDEVQ